jgi:hypothetical protein
MRKTKKKSRRIHQLEKEKTVYTTGNKILQQQQRALPVHGDDVVRRRVAP